MKYDAFSRGPPLIATVFFSASLWTTSRHGLAPHRDGKACASGRSVRAKQPFVRQQARGAAETRLSAAPARDGAAMRAASFFL